MKPLLAMIALIASLSLSGCSIVGIEREEDGLDRLKLFVFRDVRPSKTPLSIYDSDLPESNAGLIELVNWDR